MYCNIRCIKNRLSNGQIIRDRDGNPAQMICHRFSIAGRGKTPEEFRKNVLEMREPFDPQIGQFGGVKVPEDEKFDCRCGGIPMNDSEFYAPVEFETPEPVINDVSVDCQIDHSKGFREKPSKDIPHPVNNLLQGRPEVPASEWTANSMTYTDNHPFMQEQDIFISRNGHVFRARDERPEEINRLSVKELEFGKPRERFTYIADTMPRFEEGTECRRSKKEGHRYYVIPRRRWSVAKVDRLKLTLSALRKRRAERL